MTVQAKTSRVCTSDCVDDSIERNTKLKLSAILAVDFGKSRSTPCNANTGTQSLHMLYVFNLFLYTNSYFNIIIIIC